MDRKGVHINVADEWSEPHDVYGEQIRYRVWMKEDRTLCLRMAEPETGVYRIDISDSCENMDVDIPEIFDIPDFPFDSQFILTIEKDKLTLKKVGNGIYSEKDTDKQLTRIFGYKNIGELVHELTGSVR